MSFLRSVLVGYDISLFPKWNFKRKKLFSEYSRLYSCVSFPSERMARYDICVHTPHYLPPIELSCTDDSVCFREAVHWKPRKRLFNAWSCQSTTVLPVGNKKTRPIKGVSFIILFVPQHCVRVSHGTALCCRTKSTIECGSYNIVSTASANPATRVIHTPYLYHWHTVDTVIV